MAAHETTRASTIEPTGTPEPIILSIVRSHPVHDRLEVAAINAPQRASAPRMTPMSLPRVILRRETSARREH